MYINTFEGVGGVALSASRFLMGLCTTDGARDAHNRLLQPYRRTAVVVDFERVLEELEKPYLIDFTRDVRARGRECVSLLSRLMEQSGLAWAEAMELEEYKSSEAVKAYDALKKSLPVISPMSAGFIGDGRKRNENAVDNGVGMFDIDHIRFRTGLTAEEFVEEHIAPHYGSADSPLAVQLSASGDGLHVFYRRTGPGIWTSHVGMAARLGIGEELLDEKVKNPSRLCFLTSAEDWLYIDREAWARGEWLYVRSDETDRIYHSVPAANPTPATTAAISMAAPKTASETPSGGASPAQVSGADAGYDGLPWGEVVRFWLRTMPVDGRSIPIGDDGCPLTGHRNNTLYVLAQHLLHLCDGSLAKVREVLQATGNYGWGLEAAEVEATLSSANASFLRQRSTRGTGRRNATMPHQLSDILKRLRAAQASIESGVQPDDDIPLPWGQRSFVPMAMQTAANCFEPRLRTSVIIHQLPMWGILGTGLRSRRTSTGRVHAPSFISVTEAPSSTGKGFLNQLKGLLLGPAISEDLEQNKKQREYEEQLRRYRNSEHQPGDPHTYTRIIPTKTSRPYIVRQLMNGDGRHLLWIVPEISDLADNSKSPYDAPMSLLKLFADGDNIGQGRVSADAVNAPYVPGWVNVCITGTVTDMDAVFTDKLITDGTVNRLLYDEWYCDEARPADRFTPPTAEQKAIIEAAQRALMSTGFHGAGRPDFDDSQVRDLLPRTDDKLRRWTDGINDRYNLTGAGRAAVDFSHRCADMGYRAALLAYVITGCEETKEVVNFGVWVARKALHNLMLRFGSRKEKLESDQLETQRLRRQENLGLMNSRRRNILQLLPADKPFGIDEIQRALNELGQLTPANIKASRLVSQGWLKNIGRGMYHFTNAGRKKRQTA